MISRGSESEFATSVPDEVESTGDGTITPDPFLAKVARVPARRDALALAACVGDRFGRFEVRGELGRGGMGIVYVAHDTTLGREVALKVLRASGDVERRKRFMREARSAAAVTHPGIATVYDVGEQDDAVFIAMERVRGKTLRAWIDEHPIIPIVDAQRIGRAIARTLVKAHELGVVHRDLKPENAMLTEDGDVKLLDFGLAKLLGPSLSEDRSTTDTQEGRIIGTPCYMSPEQARGLTVDARSDVFSFGVMFYELLTRRRPFTGATSVDLMASITRDEPPPVNEVVPGVSAEVAAVVSRCLRKSPADRYADAGMLVKDLDAACAAVENGLSRKDGISLVPEEKPPAKNERRAARPILALALALLGVAIFVGWKVFTHRGSNSSALANSKDLNSVTMAHAAESAMPAAPSEAQNFYQQGLVEFRKGAPDMALLSQAVASDPTLAAAHLQIAAKRVFHFNAEQARKHYRKAVEYSAKLDEKQLIFLDAIEPLVLEQPSNWAESIRRFSNAVEQFPNDAQFWFYLAAATANFKDFDLSNQQMAQAIRLDPEFALARAFLAMNRAYEGRFDAAETAAEDCLNIVPDSVLCMGLLADLRSREGQCEAMAQVARRMIAAGASRASGEARLAESLAAQGQPLATIEQALEQAESSRLELDKTEPESIKKAYAGRRLLARMLAGDFETAEARARELQASSQTSHMQDDHSFVAKLLTQVLLETGRKEEAGDVLKSFLDRRNAWEPNPSAEDAAMSMDATPFLLFAAAEAETLSTEERIQHRDAWLRDWNLRATPVARNYLWMHAHATTAYSPEEAKQALEVLRKQGPVPPFRPQTLADAYVGRVYLLAGHMDEALKWLGQATQSCSTLRFPFEQTRAYLWLGQAKESKGDTKGACGAYQVVLDRWGHAKPKSVSADQARARVSALGCRST